MRKDSSPDGPADSGRSDARDGGHDASEGGGALCHLGSSLWPACAGAKACNFYVAPSGGDDKNPGTASAPLATLEALQTLLRGAPATGKVGCLKGGSGGTYDRTATLVLSAADDGETWQFDPAGALDTAILDGTNGSSYVNLIDVNANGITINGLTLRNCDNNCIVHDGGGTGVNILDLTVENNDIGPNHATTGSGGWPPLVAVNGGDTITVSHNYLHDGTAQGIGLFSTDTKLMILDHVVIDGNVVLRTPNTVSDAGSIYLQHANLYVATSLAVTNNYVRDYGATGVKNAHGIYLDYGTNHVTISGNIIGAPTPAAVSESSGAMLSDGYDDTFTDNIVDLGSTGAAWAGVWWFESSPGFSITGLGFTGNIVLSNFSGSETTDYGSIHGTTYYQSAGPASAFDIANNLYYNFGGGSTLSNGPIASDAHPVVADPLCSGYLYKLSSGSPAFGAPVSFADVAGARQAGPPGFVIPSSTQGSCP